jgi:hypothetical protein
MTSAERRRRFWDAVGVLAVALSARIAMIAWAHARFPAVEDGHYYDALARRLAAGAGYTWLWPDGAVTYAAHYPVGYPAMLALAYVALGASAGAAMAVNAVVGVAAAYGAHRLVDGEGVARWRPLAAGLCVALHPALLAYTPAVMTEGVTAGLLVVAAAVAARARAAARPWPWLVALGVAMGVVTLVRPQSLLLAPVFGALAAPAAIPALVRVVRAAAVTAVAVACVAPWTARNCVRMHRCALVSVNGGWNLLIGAQSRTGAWEPMQVPAECANVWDEAGKDACFERAARRAIAASPWPWIARAPGKLAVTLDYFGAGPWYMHASNGDAFDDAWKVRLGTVETIVSRLLLLGALVAMWRLPGARRVARGIIAAGGAISAVTVHGWVGYVAIALGVALTGRRALAQVPVVVATTAAAIAATVLVHVAFFGAGRYGLVLVPLLTAMAFVRITPRPPVATASGSISETTASPSLPAAARS